MGLFNREPKRETGLDTLEPYIAQRVRRVLIAMEQRGYDPIVYEARRSKERQKWLYGVGRTHSLHRKPVTWTLNSKHLPDQNGLGKAVDIISRERGWNWPQFYAALKVEAAKEGLHTLAIEQCHLQWEG